MKPTVLIPLAMLTLTAASAQAPAFPIVAEPLTLKLMGSKSPLQGEWQDLEVFKVLQNLTNIGFAFDTPLDDGYEERKNLIIASGDLPDLFFGGRLTSADEVNYGTQGLLAPLNPLIEANAPNLQKLLREQPAIAQSITTPDGNIYALPGITAGFGLYPKLWLNKVWLEALGMDEPKTTDELYDVLEAFKTQDPTATAKPTRSRSPRRASRTGRSTISGPDFSRPSVSASVTAKPSSTSRATPCGSSPARKAFGATSPL